MSFKTCTHQRATISSRPKGNDKFSSNEDANKKLVFKKFMYFKSFFFLPYALLISKVELSTTSDQLFEAVRDKQGTTHVTLANLR